MSRTSVSVSRLTGLRRTASRKPRRTRSTSSNQRRSGWQGQLNNPVLFVNTTGQRPEKPVWLGVSGVSPGSETSGNTTNLLVATDNPCFRERDRARTSSASRSVRAPSVTKRSKSTRQSGTPPRALVVVGHDPEVRRRSRPARRSRVRLRDGDREQSDDRLHVRRQRWRGWQRGSRGRRVVRGSRREVRPRHADRADLDGNERLHRRQQEWCAVEGRASCEPGGWRDADDPGLDGKYRRRRRPEGDEPGRVDAGGPH
jgi:hypothetical protein